MNQPMTRRAMIRSLGAGLGSVALCRMLADEQARGESPSPHFAPKAKHSIVLFMPGGPSQMDLFDPKPDLRKYVGQRPNSVNLRTERTTGGLLPSPFAFARHGRSGLEISELLPNLAALADDLCVVRSMYTFNPTHTPARSLFHSGNIAATRPSMGSWISYGLGTENQNLPGFVALSPGGGGGPGLRSGFLPPRHQGVGFNDSVTDPERMIRNLRNLQIEPGRPAPATESHPGAQPRARTNGRPRRVSRRPHPGHGDRIPHANGSVRRLRLPRTEPAAVREQYGNTPFANGCLLARRLVERGVRTVHVYYGPGQPWDDHSRIAANLRGRCPEMDRASAALIIDLKRRGLLGQTAVVWGGEFGRTPVSESGDGRDHNPFGFTMFMAGGGFKGGTCHGATDQFGFRATENRVSIHDLHATLLHVLGIDHEKLTYRYAGRDFRLTDVYGEVVRDILA